MRELETPAPISKRKIMEEPASEKLAAAVILVPYMTEEAESFVEKDKPIGETGEIESDSRSPKFVREPSED